MTDTTKNEKPTANASIEPIWVICRNPITPLLPSGKKALGLAGAMPDLFGLRFERGVNILAGHVDLGTGTQRFVSLEQLPASVAAMKEADRASELQRLFAEIRKLYHQHFEQGATFQASGTMKELVQGHLMALRTAAEKGTHKASLEALVAHPSVPDEVKQLARQRLVAWRHAA